MILILRDFFAGAVCLAFGAAAEKLQLATSDASTGKRLCLGHSLGRQTDAFQVLHFAAAGADEVRVGCCVEIKPLQTVDNTDGLNHALFFEHGDIAVDSSQTQIREVALELLIDPFSTGVALGLPDAVEDGITLSAVFSDSLHVSLHFDNSYYYKHNLTQDARFVKREMQARRDFFIGGLRPERSGFGRNKQDGLLWKKERYFPDKLPVSGPFLPVFRKCFTVLQSFQFFSKKQTFLFAISGKCAILLYWIDV